MAKKKKTKAPEITYVEHIVDAAMDDIMGERFGVYAKEVIQNRAIPDVRDGLKPVQRRIIFAMNEDGNTFNKPTKKCAHTVGSVMGKYHPHGDSSIYEALARMSQPWVMRLPLIDFQGNNGSIDGDSPAAYRYTEARLGEVSEELVRDLKKDTVDMMLTFDDTDLEPTVLPARYPNLYVNGAQGIAVGVATEIPPHNLGEIIDAVIHRLSYKRVSVDDLRAHVLGPDFPTGGIIYNTEGLDAIYETGRGRIEIEARTHIEEQKNLNLIVVTEIPYAVNKNNIIKELDAITRNKQIDGIIEARDESDREGLRIVIEVRKDVDVEIIRDFILNKTSLRSGYSANIVAIVDGRPKTLSLLDYVDAYVAHQRDVLTRRSNFDLVKFTDRLHIVDGLIQAISVVDEVVKIIRASKDKQDAKANLMARYKFSELQAEAIVTLQLYKLTNTDISVLEAEASELRKNIADLKEILADENKLDKIIIQDLKAIKAKYATPRLSEIGGEREVVTIDKRDLIAEEKVMIAVTKDGYIKRSSLKSYTMSGENALPGIKPGDLLISMGEALTTDFLIAFTNLGNYFYLPIYELQDIRWKDEGNHINYLVSLGREEKIIKTFLINDFRADLYFISLSKKGQIKRSTIKEYEVTRYKRTIRSMRLLKSDEIIDVAVSSGNSNVLVVANDGKATFFNENELTILSTTAGGVKALNNLKKATALAVITYLPNEKGKLVALTDKGHLRIFDINYLELTPRLGKMQSIFKLFKSDTHNLIYLAKLEHAQTPFSLNALTSSSNVLTLNVSDLRPTQLDKYAKKNIDELAEKDSFVGVYNEKIDLISKDLESYEPEIIETPVEEKVVKTSEKPLVDEETDKEAYEQISIFDVMGD